MIQVLRDEHRLSITRACKIAQLTRAAYYRDVIEPLKRDTVVIEALNALIEQDPGWGFWKCFDRLRHLGYRWNHKRVHRIYCAMNLNRIRKTKRRVPKRERQSLLVVPQMNAVWALDFMHDALYCGRKIRTLNVMDEANRQALGIDVATSIPAIRVTRFLDQLLELHGRPNAIRCDNGPELTSGEFSNWCKSKDIEIRYIQPGKPDQNAFIERFNRTYRAGVLDAWLFETIAEVQEVTDEWLKRYNEIRPHDALGKLPPVVYRQQVLEANVLL